MVIFYCNYDITLLSHQNRKKLVEKASRSEGVYNRADEPSVTFCEKGAATKHTKKRPFYERSFLLQRSLLRRGGDDGRQSLRALSARRP